MKPLIILLVLFGLVASSGISSSVIDLNEKFLDVKDDGFWFIKFYAPWCAHCKKLAPVWEHVGHAMTNMAQPIRIAKVDCTRFPSVCQELHIHAYPTLVFFRNGKTFNYEGERRKESMVDYAIKAAAPLVQDIKDMVMLNEIRQKSRDDPSFAFIDYETIGDDEQLKVLRDDFDLAAETLFGKTRFYKIRHSIVPTELREENDARVVAFKDAPPTLFRGVPDDLHKWILGNRWPLLPQAIGPNIADLSSGGKLLVLLVLAETEKGTPTSAVSKMYQEGLEAARLVREDKELNDRYQFAWLDGNDIANNIVMGTIEIPDILLFNYTSYEYYLNTDAGNRITAKSIVEWLRQMTGEDIQPLGGRGMIQRTKRIFYEVFTQVHNMFATQPLLTTCLFGVPIAFLSIICYSICSADFSVDRDEVYPDSEFSDEGDEEIDGRHSEDENSPIDPSHAKSE
ncbi:unnamed protein product, partial [Mesorhabditis spiculigera]